MPARTLQNRSALRAAFAYGIAIALLLPRMARRFARRRIVMFRLTAWRLAGCAGRPVRHRHCAHRHWIASASSLHFLLRTCWRTSRISTTSLLYRCPQYKR